MKTVPDRVKRNLTIIAIVLFLVLGLLTVATVAQAESKCQDSPTVCWIKKYWKDEGSQQKALQVSYCESRHDPRAQNPSGARGVFQLMPSHQERAARVGREQKDADGKPGEPYSWDDIYDAGKNTRVAYDLFSEERAAGRSGWGPWVCA